jgi:hypothetical protein
MISGYAAVIALKRKYFIMEKILVAVDPAQINMNVVDFACYIANLTHSRLKGIFIHDSQENIQQFRDACQNRGVNCYFHAEQAATADEFIRESRFADLLIIDPSISYGTKKESTPTTLVKDILSECECPVVIAPYDFEGIDEILVAYDGSASAVFAIKQFTYLFPKLADRKLTILQVTENDEITITEKDRLRELVQMHYSSIGFHLLNGKAENELFGYLIGKKNAFVVMGAFGRTMLSGLFRRSTADILVQAVDLPIFVAHH